MAFDAMKDGTAITAAEGLARDGALHPLQVFINHDAFQCGNCMPGQICSGVALIEEGTAHTRDEIRELMSGNISMGKRVREYPITIDKLLRLADLLSGRSGANIAR